MPKTNFIALTTIVTADVMNSISTVVWDFLGNGEPPASKAEIKANLNLEPGSDIQAFDASLTDIAGLNFVQGDIIYHNGVNLVKLVAGTSGEFLKTLGAGLNPEWGTPAGGGGGGGGGDLLSANNLNDVADAALSLGNLNGQPVDLGLTSISGLTTTANKGIFTTASDTYATFDLTLAGRNLLDDADITAQRATLGASTVGNALFIATNVAAAQQAMDTEVGIDIPGLATQNQFTQTQNSEVVNLARTNNSPSGRVSWNGSTQQVVAYTQVDIANTFDANPSIMESVSAQINGAFYNIKIINGTSTGNTAISWDVNFKFIGGIAPTLTQTAGAIDYITFRSDGSTMSEVGRALDVK